MKRTNNKYKMIFNLMFSLSVTLAIVVPTGIPHDLTYPEIIFEPPLQYEIQKLLASDGMVEDCFGYSVALDEDVAIVSAPQDDVGEMYQGSVYIYRFNGNVWEQEQKLLASDGEYLDLFGDSVAIDGNIAVVGCSGDDDVNPYDPFCNSGAVYVYRYDGVLWREETKIVASDSAEGDYFGCAVVLDNERILVGAHQSRYPNTPGAGAAYLYHFDGSEWVEEQKLLTSDGLSGDRFGHAVALDDSVALIGAFYDDDLGEHAGSAYIFRYEDSTWNQEQKLLASDGTLDDHFGCSVAIENTIAIIGAEYDDDNGDNSGSTYVFRDDGSLWTEEQKLVASDAEAKDFFGCAVAIDHQKILIGASDSYELDPGYGSTYVYSYDDSQWYEEVKLVASDGSLKDKFGHSIAVCDNTVLVGADGYDLGRGAAYLYDLPLQADINGDGVVNTQDLLMLLAAWGNPGGPEDINGDGIVDTADLLILLAHWTVN